MTYFVPNASSDQAVTDRENVKKYFQKLQVVRALRCERFGELVESAVNVTGATSSGSLHLKSGRASHHLHR